MTVSSIVLDGDAVGHVVSYVAPGFLAFVGYRTRYPAPSRPAGELLLISVVLSLPLVAVAQALLPGDQRPDDIEYVALLLIGAAVLGYGAAWLRGRQRTASCLERLGHRIQPEGTIWAQTVKHMSADGSVLVELKDGRRIWGRPREGPQTKEDGINELYLVYAKAQDGEDDGLWHDIGPVIVPLDQVVYVVLDEEPTAVEKDRTRAATRGHVSGS